MNDFETAVDQILADSDGESALSYFESGRAHEFDPLEDSESYVDFEGLDTHNIDDEMAELENADFESAFGSSFESANGYGYESFVDFENLGDDSEWRGEADGFSSEFDDARGGSMLSEAEVEELARDLVGVSTPEDMEAFFGKIFQGVKKVAGKALSSGLGKKLLRAGSGLVGRALPIVGSSLGTALLPGVGTGLGGALGGQLKNLFAQRGRQSLGKALTRQAVNSARRLGQRNPLTSMLGRQGGNALRSLFGFEAEAAYGDPQLELAKRVIRTVADAARIAGHSDNESDSAIAEAYRRAANRNLPPAVRAAMLSGPVT